jgi:hypothetical protein
MKSRRSMLHLPLLERAGGMLTIHANFSSVCCNPGRRYPEAIGGAEAQWHWIERTIGIISI